MIIPHFMLLSSPCFTASFQWKGTGMGICLAYGSAFELRWMCASGAFISGNGMLWLNVVLLNWSSKYCFNLGIFSSVGGNGMIVGHCGNVVSLFNLLVLGNGFDFVKAL